MDTLIDRAANVELVSVIMPAYNAARYIVEAIESVRVQTYSHWELLIVDDGSTDATRPIVEEYSRQDVRIRYFYQDNARQGRARNNGIAHAEGSLIAFLDADDVWLPHKLATQVPQLQANNADLVFSDAFVFQETFQPGRSYEMLNTGRGVLIGQAGVEVCLRKNPVAILTVLTTREAIIRMGGFSENHAVQNAEDYHLWLHMLLAGCKLIGFEEALAAYRDHPSSVSGTDILNSRQVVEAKVELAQAFPAEQKKIQESLDYTIWVGLAKAVSYDNPTFYTVANRYLIVTHRSAWRPVLALWQQLGLRKLALRNLYFIFNYC